MPIYYNSEYLKELYGETIYRIPIDLDFGCPNREADGSGGCIFCAEHGSRSMQTMQQESIDEQIEKAIDFAKKRYKAKRFMAYFQAYSAKFDTKAQKQYREIIKKYNFKVVTIATRPDCLDQEEGYDFLKELAKEVDLWLELGVQTVHDKTLKLINRGHDWQTGEVAIKKLNDIDVKVAVHVIIGLPGESESDILETAKTLSELPIGGIKIHNLHVLKNTELANLYQKEKFKTYNEYEYGEILMQFLRYLPSDLPVMRLSTDSIKEDVIAPQWHMNKCSFLEYIQQQMIYREFKQGDLCEKKSTQVIVPAKSNYEKVITKDGSLTYWNDEVKEHYHSAVGALKEAREKYLIPSNLEKMLNISSPYEGEVAAEGRRRGQGLTLLDVCFGLGYNSLVALDTAIKNNQKLDIYALEIDKRVVGAAARDLNLGYQLSFDYKKVLSDLYESGESEIAECSVKILWGDARYTITKIKENSIDVVYLDPFSTNRNSQLWTVDFFKQIKSIMKENASIYTYCAAIPVRAGLLEAGFFVGETLPIGRVRGGTIATLDESNIEIDIPDKELKAYQTNRGIPYSDPHRIWTNKQVLRDREEKIEQLKKTKV